MATIVFRDGRRPPHPESTHPRLKFASIRTAGPAPAAPPLVDYVTKVADWPMYQNDLWGDCVFAAIGHIIEAATTYGQGATITISDADVLGAYSAVTGFDPDAGPPGNNPTDQGTVIQDALGYWRKVGVGGHRILAFAEVNVHDPDEVDAALWMFGHLELGINFPASAMDQFNAGQPWDVVPHSWIEGGHAIDLGYSSDTPRTQVIGRAANGNLKVITWGRVQEMTPSFWDAYVEEAWVVITPEWYDAQGRNPEGIDSAALGEAFTALTGEPSPFHAAPAPTPPEPSPAPLDDADRALAGAVRPWLRLRHRGTNADTARALKAWLAAKNL